MVHSIIRCHDNKVLSSDWRLSSCSSSMPGNVANNGIQRKSMIRSLSEVLFPENTSISFEIQINNLAMEDKNQTLLIPQDLSKTTYKGYIVIGGAEYKVSLMLKAPDSFIDAEFSCCSRLSDILKPYRTPLGKKLKRCTSIRDFLSELEAAIEAITGIKINDCDSSCFDSNLETIFKELESIGWDNVISVSDNFRELQLSFRDERDYSHILGMQLDSQYPKTKPYCVTNTPLALNVKWPPKGKNYILDVYNQFVAHINLFQNLWKDLEIFDEKCWILEPSKPLKSSTHRRMILNNNCSLLVTLNPLKPRLFPECRFFGPEYAVNPLKEKLYAGLHHWSDNECALQNLETILEIEFPSREDENMEELNIDCGICYSYHIEDSIPEKTCEHPKCGKVYHSACLLEWLRTLPNFKQSFNIVFGECPHCSANLTIKLN